MITNGKYYSVFNVSSDEDPKITLICKICDAKIKAYASSPTAAKKHYKVS